MHLARFPPPNFILTTPVYFRLFLFEHIIEISSAISPIYRFDLKLMEQGAVYIHAVPPSRFLFLAYMSRACSSAIHKYQGTHTPLHFALGHACFYFRNKLKSPELPRTMNECFHIFRIHIPIFIYM